MPAHGKGGPSRNQCDVATGRPAYKVNFAAVNFDFLKIPEPRPQERNIILIHSPSKEAVTKKNKYLYALIYAETIPDDENN